MLITNATIVTWQQPNRLLTGHAVLVQNGRIQEIGPQEDLLERYSHAWQLDARGQLLLPGNICAHTHFYGMYARGMAVAGPPPRDFSAILKQLWWPLDQALNEEAVRLSALVCLVDAIKHGTTTLIDHHASPDFLTGSLDAIAAQVSKAGLRAVLCYETTDRYGPEKAEEAIAENVRFMKQAPARYNGLIAGMFGLHAPLTLSEATLQACLNAAPAGSGFHIHVHESQHDGQKVMAETGKKPVAWLNEIGILGPKTLLAHAVHVDDEEIALLADSRTWVSHQPRSNMNNAVGVAPVEKMLAAGIPVCIGNDGFSNNMLEDWRAAYLLHKVHQRDPQAMNGTTVMQMGIHNNAALAECFFTGQTLGRIEAGAAADLILLDYQPPTPLTEGNLPWHILFGFRESMVTTTIVNGKLLMQDRQLLTLNEAEIMAQARVLAPRIWEKYNDICKGLVFND